MKRHPLGVFREEDDEDYYAVVSESEWIPATTESFRLSPSLKNARSEMYIRKYLLPFTLEQYGKGLIAYAIPCSFFQGED